MIFDLDGVLVDSAHAVFESYRRACETAGVVLKEREFLGSMDGLKWPDSILSVHPGLRDEQLDTIRNEKDKLFALMEDKIDVNLRAVQLLRQFQLGGAETCIATAGSHSSTDVKLRVLCPDLVKRLKWIQVRADKHDEKVLLRLCEGRPERCCILVDDNADICLKARELGMVAIHWKE